ncbi:MAG: ABC transporter substrate-binding protein [Dehalococcoidales bacterium]|nr:ABC transporter substrate-binding protein [Dehalococcoidales bacterium]
MKGIALVTLAFFITLSGTLSACSPNESSRPAEPLVVAYSPFESAALLWIAQDKRFFEHNALNIALRKYDTGAGSLDAVLNNEADVVLGVKEFPVVRKIPQNSNIRIFGVVAKVENQFLVGRKDRGIEKASDLKGKRVGTTIGTMAEFYLGRFLEANGMSIKDVSEVDLKTPAEWENAVADGVVDAIVTAQPYADLAVKHLGNNGVIWPVQGGVYNFGLAASSDAWLKEHPELTVRFLKSLSEAEEYARRNPEEAKAIVQKELGMDASFIESTWLRSRFSLSLDQTLVTAMEAEARWLISNNLTTKTQVPNFLDYIVSDGLKTVKPEAVTLVGK